MPQALSLAFDDFLALRRNHRTYIDKTAFVAALLTTGAQVTLFCRPRRFGKSLFLSVLRYFVEQSTEDRRDCFTGLHITRTPLMQSHFQKFPVITLDLKGVRGSTWEELREGIAHAVSQEVARHRVLLTSPQLTTSEQALCQRFADTTASPLELAWSLKTLSRLLQQHYGQPVYILIDEYDSPIHQAWLKGAYEPAISFFRIFYGEAFKGNTALAQGVLTGVLKIAREGIFSNFNNPQVITVLSNEYDAAFGFTEAEVEQLRAWSASEVPMEQLQQWYNGYRIGSATIYNPWSILSCIKDPAHRPQPYWVETSSNDVLVEIIRRAGPAIHSALPTWLAGAAVPCRYSDTLLLRQSVFTDEEVSTLLLHAGYLTPERVDWLDEPVLYLRIPNRDVQAAFRRASRSWLSGYLAGYATIERLCTAILKGQSDIFESILAQIVLRSVGQADTVDNPTRGVYPEQFYHALMLGLLVALEGTHRVVSNQESGFGRPDMMLLPRQPGQPGALLEFKKRDGKVETTQRKAKEQIQREKYLTALQDAGAAPIWTYVVVFDGKDVQVEPLQQ